MFKIVVFVGVDFFPLQRLHEAFATGIVVGVCRPTHARNHVVLLEDGYIFRASVLQPSIRVMHEAWLWLSALDGLLQRSDGQPPRQGVIQRPARHFANKTTED